ncbi:NAD(P)/FAD-dependent oxidoreductase [Fusibacter paucivorans]|uniref:NAD(P)/FAD-dependent oxidoreductase n=1 Tax=Fusibacter paucivorans TaxID=76009 RepID=A0ABS5PM73_9FIRM|nr:NAD(P)/FAD-dependent oxidoreductase [Fusibacter paucivorans]MBS7526158.1 NAD(P)/FAD-dependent oxidoreductase [Fusibacter paucivorans]
MSFQSIRRQIETLSPGLTASEERGCIVLRGEVDDWQLAVRAGELAVDKKRYLGVINHITLKGFTQHREKPTIQDTELAGATPDVLIIGGGITGCAAARELTQYNLDILLVESKSDVACGASGANGGVVHVGINFSKKSQKHHYNQRGNRMYANLSKQLNVPFEQKGQTMLCLKSWEKIPVWLLKHKSIKMGIPGVQYLSREALLKHEPHIPDFVIGGMYMPIGGITNPYELTIAMAENAIQNGANIMLNTMVTDITEKDGHIESVLTNRGRIFPKLVINAAGIYADEIAEMAGDRTFTIHPRRGTDIITDKKVGYMVESSMGISPFAIMPHQLTVVPKNPVKRFRYYMKSLLGKNHTKGVGLIHSVHGNMLIGPNAVETPDREDTATYREEVASILEVQKQVAVGLSNADIIAYFTGVRAATYEEDFVVRKGIFTDNIIEAAGIQSPGLTAAPAIAEDVAKWAVDYLSQSTVIERNAHYNPNRQNPPKMSNLDDTARHALIKENPDYGIIICRCEEISKGEILDALNSELCVPTLDGIKRRLRPGMGRCQGGFCAPLITQIIAQHQNVSLSDVRKRSQDAVILYHTTKGGRL